MTATLQERLQEAIVRAEKALNDGDLETARKHRSEAETLKAALDELSTLDALRPTASVYRPPLPVGPVQDVDIKTRDKSDGGNIAKAFYNLRFGDVNKAVNAILTDLYGPDYESLYWTQKIAFGYYLRSHPQHVLPDWVVKAGRQIILTPNLVLEALSQGLDVATLKATMIESADTLGGYIVPVDFQARVIERMAAIAVVRPRADRMRTSRDAVELPKVTGGDGQYTSSVRITWVDETPVAGAAETGLTFGLERVPVHTVMAETHLSRNLVEDSVFPVEEYLARKFAEAAAIDEDNRFLIGNGVGKPQGILPGGTNGLGLTEVPSGHASQITFDSLVLTTFGIDAQYRQQAVWIMSRATAGAIALLKDANDQYLWRDMMGNNQTTGGAGRMLTLLGYPVLEQEIMPAVSANAYPVVFGDLSGYAVVDRIGMSVERYLDSATARTNTVVYVMRRRLGGQVLEPWRFATMKIAAS